MPCIGGITGRVDYSLLRRDCRSASCHQRALKPERVIRRSTDMPLTAAPFFLLQSPMTLMIDLELPKVPVNEKEQAAQSLRSPTSFNGCLRQVSLLNLDAIRIALLMASEGVLWSRFAAKDG